MQRSHCVRHSDCHTTLVFIMCRWRNQTISYVVPEDLVPLMELYVTKVHKLLAAAGERSLFIHHNTGTALTLPRLNAAWRTLLEKSQAAALFPPRRLRFIFFNDRLENPDVPGPSNEGAAAASANSVSAWSRYYCVTYKNMRAQQAVDAMKEYREACRLRLAERGAEIEQLQQQEAAAAGPAAAAPHPIVEIMDALDEGVEEQEESDFEIELDDSEAEVMVIDSDTENETDVDSAGYEELSDGSEESL